MGVSQRCVPDSRSPWHAGGCYTADELLYRGSLELCGVKFAERVARQGLRCPTPHNSGLHITHVTPSGVSERYPKLLGSRQSSLSLPPSLRSSRTKAPSLRRHYPASPVLRASPPPCRPKLALTGFRLARARHRQGFPCCIRFPARACCRQYPGGDDRPFSFAPHGAVPVAGSLPRDLGGSASALTFSRPARRSLALRPARSLSRPRRPFFTGVLQSISLPPRTAPIATGWNEQVAGRVYPRWGAVPLHGAPGHVVCSCLLRAPCIPPRVRIRWSQAARIGRRRPPCAVRESRCQYARRCPSAPPGSATKWVARWVSALLVSLWLRATPQHELLGTRNSWVAGFGPATSAAAYPRARRAVTRARPSTAPRFRVRSHPIPYPASQPVWTSNSSARRLRVPVPKQSREVLPRLDRRRSFRLGCRATLSSMPW